mmetsp:Transcript_28758/g.62995  ORF Transcript_28758/g.62995 Transcript_28758/m.62995 type:complete len:258 (-) Transcript_28758:1551-2324(-)
MRMYPTFWVMSRSTVHHGLYCRLVRVQDSQLVLLRPSVAMPAWATSLGLFSNMEDWYAGACRASDAPPESGSIRFSTQASDCTSPAGVDAVCRGSSPKVTVSLKWPAAYSRVPYALARSFTEVTCPGPTTARCSHATLKGRWPLLLSLSRKASAARATGAPAVASPRCASAACTPKVAFWYQNPSTSRLPSASVATDLAAAFAPSACATWYAHSMDPALPRTSTFMTKAQSLVPMVCSAEPPNTVLPVWDPTTMAFP